MVISVHFYLSTGQGASVEVTRPRLIGSLYRFCYCNNTKHKHRKRRYIPHTHRHTRVSIEGGMHGELRDGHRYKHTNTAHTQRKGWVGERNRNRPINCPRIPSSASKTPHSKLQTNINALITIYSAGPSPIRIPMYTQ